MKNLLEIEDLVLKFYTYEGVVEALDEVNLNLREGETLGVVGETGCGKSVTALSTLVLVPAPGRIEGGHIFFRTQNEQVDMLGQSESVLRKIRGKEISMIFQEPRVYLNPVYTVFDQISEVYVHHRMKELCQRALVEVDNEIKSGKASFLVKFERLMFKEILKNPRSSAIKVVSKIPFLNRYRRRLKRMLRGEVVEMLKAMEIADPERVVDMYPHELSGGMAQRVVIAMALACNPKLLIADEPTTNLDVTVQLQILNLVKNLKEKFGSSVLYITHDMGVVADICQRVAVMYAGSVCEIADVMDIFKDPLHPYTKGLLESIPLPGRGFKSIGGVVPSLINPPKGCRFHDRCPFALEICAVMKPKMIEVKKDHFVRCHLFGDVLK
jgi:peptide/nickel transport system ATP-binding protein